MANCPVAPGVEQHQCQHQNNEQGNYPLLVFPVNYTGVGQGTLALKGNSNVAGADLQISLPYPTAHVVDHGMKIGGPVVENSQLLEICIVKRGRGVETYHKDRISLTRDRNAAEIAPKHRMV